MTSLIGVLDVEEAGRRLAGRTRLTPVLEVDLEDGTPIVLKLELLQLTGTFKARGAFNTLLTSTPPASGVIAASGGNHGIAVAYAGRALGIPVEIFVPQTSAAVKVARLKSFGAKVFQVGEDYADSLGAMRERMEKTGALEVHAYDQPQVIAGQGTVTFELLAQCPEIQTIVIAVGGGGLIAGAMACVGGTRRLVAVEPRSACALNAALEAGRPVDVPVAGIAADSLGARRVGSLCFELAETHGIESVLVDDEEIVQAQRWLWSQCRLVAEPGGAAALAALLSGRIDRRSGERIAVVVCGANTDPGSFSP